jgi:hypothetical protein
MYDKASISLLGKSGEFELAQDINKIAIQNLKDRMLRELGVALLRVALKQTAEIAARKNDKDGLGMALSILNAVTEKADTRNWQTLPRDISYTRINLPQGKHEFTVNTRGKRGNISKNGFIEIKNNQTTFHTINSVETTKVL